MLSQMLDGLACRLRIWNLLSGGSWILCLMLDYVAISVAVGHFIRFAS